MTTPLYNMTPQDVRSAAEGIVNNMLAQQKDPTSIDKIYAAIVQKEAAYWPMGGMVTSEIKKVADANNVAFTGKGADTAKAQFNVMLDAVAKAIYDAKEQIEKSEPKLAGGALSQKIAETTQSNLMQNQRFKNALGFANDLSKLQDAKAPDVTVNQVAEYAKGWLDQNVVQQVAQKSTTASATPDKEKSSEKPIVKAATTPAVVGVKPKEAEQLTATAPAKNPEVAKTLPVAPVAAPAATLVSNSTPPPSAPAATPEKQPEKPKWQDLSKADAEEVTRQVASQGFFNSEPMALAFQNLMTQGVNGKKGSRGLPDEDKPLEVKVGDAYNQYGKPIWDTLVGFLKMAVTFVMTLLSNGGDFGKALEVAQLQGTASKTGQQMSDSLHLLRDSLPMDLAYTDKTTGATPEVYKEIYTYRNDVIAARKALQKAEKGKDSKLHESARIRLDKAEERWEKSDDKIKQQYNGVDSEGLWNYFVAWKTNLMDATAGLMGERAKANGLGDTPTDGKLMIQAWRGDKAVTNLVEPHKSQVSTPASPQDNPSLESLMDAQSIQRYATSNVSNPSSPSSTTAKTSEPQQVKI